MRRRIASIVYAGLFALSVSYLLAHQAASFSPSPASRTTRRSRCQRQRQRTCCSPPTCITRYALDLSILDPIVQHPATKALSIDIRPRSRLKRTHQHLFDTSNSSVKCTSTSINSTTATVLFDKLGLVACSTGVVCRKEFLETFAAATCIHAKFPDSKRMADLAAGHGLLAWFLLALDHSDNDHHSQYGNDDTAKHYDHSTIKANTTTTTTTTTTTNTNTKPRTVVCVDRRMPRSADIIASAMLERFPDLEGRWSYVQSDLSAIQAHPSCVLTSVHACGTLSDTLIDMSIATGAPLAIVPCCHTVRHGYRPHFFSGMIDSAEVAALVEERKKKQKHAKHEAVAEVVDDVRCRTLKNAGYHVEEILLPEAFTARNRLILAEPATPIMDASSRMLVSSSFHHKSRPFFQRQPEGGLVPPPSLIRIPLADDPDTIAHCHTLSQIRAHAATSKTVKHIVPRHVSLTLAMSIWLVGGSTEETGSCDNHSELVTAETLEAFANHCCREEMETETAIQCTVETFGEVNVQSTTGRRSQLFKFKYVKSDGTTIRGASRTAAKTIHEMLRERIVDKFGDLVR
jgi:hypothetical protein